MLSALQNAVVSRFFSAIYWAGKPYMGFLDPDYPRFEYLQFDYFQINCLQFGYLQFSYFEFDHIDLKRLD